MENIAIMSSKGIVEFLKEHLKLEVTTKIVDDRFHEEWMAVKIAGEVITEACIRREQIPDWG